MKKFAIKKVFIISSVVIVVVFCAFGFFVYSKVSNNKACKYLTKVEDLQELLEQILERHNANCLLKQSPKGLAAAWKIKIYEITDEESSGGPNLNEIKNAEIVKALNQPYQNPNDAYIVVVSKSIKKIRNVYNMMIYARNDYLHQSKGLNQWIPKRSNGEFVWDIGSRTTSTNTNDIKWLAEELKTDNFLPGFVAPLSTHSTHVVSPSSDAELFISFDTPPENNYVDKISVTVRSVWRQSYATIE